MLSSAAVNVLALGAFWISPGLRTTANRFVINLLVVNVVACIALVPALWLNGGLKTTFHSSYDDEDEFGSFASAASNNRLVVDEPKFDLNVQPLHVRYGHHLPRPHLIDPAKLEEKLIDKEIASDSLLQSIESAIIEREAGILRAHDADEMRLDCHRFWGFDLAATLGKHENMLITNRTTHLFKTSTKTSTYFDSIAINKYIAVFAASMITNIVRENSTTDRCQRLTHCDAKNILDSISWRMRVHTT